MKHEARRPQARQCVAAPADYVLSGGVGALRSWWAAGWLVGWRDAGLWMVPWRPSATQSDAVVAGPPSVGLRLVCVHEALRCNSRAVLWACERHLHGTVHTCRITTSLMGPLQMRPPPVALQCTAQRSGGPQLPHALLNLALLNLARHRRRRRCTCSACCSSHRMATRGPRICQRSMAALAPCGGLAPASNGQLCGGYGSPRTDASCVGNKRLLHESGTLYESACERPGLDYIIMCGA
jgi:hypothetical protein